MKLIVIPAILLCAAFLSPRASADVVAFGPTNQNIILTGLGGNAQGEGQDRVTWGSCAFNGTNTVCTVTSPFTGLGGGGTVSWVLTYQGNGPSPLVIGSLAPGGDLLGPFSLSSGSFVTTFTKSNGTILHYYGQAPYFTYNQTQCTVVTVCGPGQVGLTVGATITGTVTGTFDTTPVIRPGGVISASAYGGFQALAPGTWMEIYGSNLATVLVQGWSGADFNGNLAPSALAGTTVTIGGQAAFIDYVSPGQVNAQVPSNVAFGPQPVVVTTLGGSSVASTITVNATEPGLLAPAAFNLKAGQYIAALFPDGVTFVLPPGAIAGLASARAKPGDTITFYGVGFGSVTPDSPAGQIVTQSNRLSATFLVSFAGTPATVAFSGLTGGYLGLYQFNVVVPNVAASDAVPVTFSVGGKAGTQTLLIAIQN